MREANARGGTDQANAFVVGVDGGGTRTTVALYDAQNPVDQAEPLAPISRGTTEPAAVHPSDPEQSVERIEQAVRERATEANRALPAEALVAGLAGAGRTDVRNKLQRALRKNTNCNERSGRNRCSRGALRRV